MNPPHRTTWSHAVPVANSPDSTASRGKNFIPPHFDRLARHRAITPLLGITVVVALLTPAVTFLFPILERPMLDEGRISPPRRCGENHALHAINVWAGSRRAGIA